MRNPTLAFTAAFGLRKQQTQRIVPSTATVTAIATAAATAARTQLFYNSFNDDDNEQFNEEDFLKDLARMESMEQIIQEFNQDGSLEGPYDLDDYNYEYEYEYNEKDDFRDLFENEIDLEEQGPLFKVTAESANSLEQALMKGVVPVSAGVGSGCLPGDLGFDPLELSTKDYIGRAHHYMWNFGTPQQMQSPAVRPSALILRDYREAEIRHGRLAMMAAILWPLQEMLDRLLLDDNQFGPIVYAKITLPYIPLFMTAVMLLLGYLDIYSSQMKEQNDIGEAFLPGDCFWDPLCILEGGDDRMKRNMSERELWNSRMAMLAVVLYAFEEFTSHKPLISIESNSLLFEPAYQIPVIQDWLDTQFSFTTSTNMPFEDGDVLGNGGKDIRNELQ